MTMKSGIYKIVNNINGKQYVGSAMDLVKRKRAHWNSLRLGYHHNVHLQRAWDKYGEGAFEFRVVGKCPIERLIELEQEVIDHLKPDYNISSIAGSTLGLKREFSDEHRRNLSKSNMGKKPSDEAIKKSREARIGKPLSAAHREKLSKALVGRKHSDEHNRRMGITKVGNQNWLGRKHTSETRQKMVDAWKLRRATEKNAVEFDV